MAEKFPTPQERAMAWLLEATEIGGMSRPETALYAYQADFKAALDWAIEIENALCEPDANEQAEPEQVPVSAENGRESMASASHSTINDETEETDDRTA